MKLYVQTVLLFALLMLTSGCSNVGSPNFAVADMTLKASEQAALKIQDGLFVSKMDNDAKQPWLMKGYPESPFPPDIFIIPQGEHTFEVFLSQATRNVAVSSAAMRVKGKFLPGHYYILNYTPDFDAKTVSFSITDHTSDQWWIENRNALWEKYEEMKKDPNNPFVKVARER